MPMRLEDKQEQLSLAALHATCAKAGFAFKVTSPTMPDALIQTVARIAPRDAQGYARSRGWLQDRRVGHLMVYNRPESGALDQLLVPMDAGRPDFAERMIDLVDKLSRYERRSPVQIVTDILNYDADVLRIRVVSNRAERGMLPLSQAINLLDGARRSLLAAAHSALTPRKRHPKLSRTEAVQLLNACQMGQTEGGSFVVTITCPLRAVDAEEAGLLDDQTPFARQATSLLWRALNELNTAIEENRLAEITSASRPIVSANLCEAVLRMRPADESGRLEFTASWASSLPPSDREIRNTVALSSDEFAAIEDAYHLLRPAQESQAKPWVAFVDELKGTEGADGLREGEVVFTLFDDDDLIRAKANLNVDHYRIAYDAHNPSKPLIVFGQLHRGPRVSRLAPITEIRPAIGGD